MAVSRALTLLAAISFAIAILCAGAPVQTAAAPPTWGANK
jgi:hypothetical protein